MVLSQAVTVLQRARHLGIEPNTVMYNTAISALGKGGCWEAAEQLFAAIPNPDTVSYETMIAAYGLAGQAARAEAFFTTMLEAGHLPRDYAFCGLIAAYRYGALEASGIAHDQPATLNFKCHALSVHGTF